MNQTGRFMHSISGYFMGLSTSMASEIPAIFPPDSSVFSQISIASSGHLESSSYTGLCVEYDLLGGLVAIVYFPIHWE